MWKVLFTEEAARERLVLPPRERNALMRAVQKLEALGPNLGYPHSSSLKEHGDLRELRPRGGRSLWRAFYRRIGDAFVVAAVGPAAEHDKRGFDRAARRARTRLDEIAED